MISIAELAKELNFTELTIRRKIKNDAGFRELFIKINTQYRVKLEDVIEYMKVK